MSISWFVLLTPIVLLLVALPFLFVGCATFTVGEGDPVSMPGPPLGIAKSTTFLLEMDPNLQAQLSSPVVKIQVTWLVQATTGAPPAIKVPPVPAVITTRLVPAPNPPALRPKLDDGAIRSIPSNQIGTRDRVKCNCSVTLADGTTPIVTSGTRNPAVLANNGTNEFRIMSRSPKPGFEVNHHGA